MSHDLGKFLLTADTTFQFRRAQGLDARLAKEIRSVCEASEQINACYLLDARKPDTEEMVLIIAVTLDEEAKYMDLVAQQFQAILQQFPIYSSKTFIMSSASFIDRYAGTEFYAKKLA